MKVNITPQKLYRNKIVRKGLEFASSNSALFVAGTSLALSTVVRPLSILATPKTDEQNKKLACAKSIASSAIGYLLMLGVSMPFARGVKKIDEKPAKYLKSHTIKTLRGTSKKLEDSKAYQFATQLFKLGLGFAIAMPKAFLTTSLIPPITKVISNNDEKKNSAKEVSFGHNVLAKGMGKVINTDVVQKTATRFKDTNFPFYMMAMSDIVATGAMVHQVNKNDKINENRKKVLNTNAVLSTGLCLTAGYAIDRALEKPTKNLIKDFSKANKNYKNLGKCIEGIKIAKPTFILGTIYYAFIPMISTFLAERITPKISPEKTYNVTNLT